MCNVGDLGYIPELGRSPGGGHGNPHSSILVWRIPLDGRAWRATVRGAERVGHDRVIKHSPAQIYNCILISLA